MKKRKITALLMSAVMAIGIIPSAVTMAEDTQIDKAEYQYFLHNAEDSAYAMLGEKVEQKGLEFIDGIGKDKSDETYNELVNVDGLDARRQYSANYMYFKVDDDFYEEGDTEFMFSIVFYDYGPSEGKYYFEYHTTGGATKQVTLIKPGTNPGWSVKTITVDDVDLSATYANGATVRIMNGAFNAFRKFEIVNINKARRENKVPDITCLGNDILREMANLRLLNVDDPRFANQNFGKPVTAYDVQDLKNIVTNNPKATNTESKTETMTQGQLVTTFMQAVGATKKDGESAVEVARRLGIIDASGLFLFDEAPATNYNLVAITYSILAYEAPDGKNLLDDIINSGFYNGVDLTKISNEVFQYRYYSVPRKCPYSIITEPATGRTFKYVDFFGGILIRPYLSNQSWTNDGKRFICGTTTGYLYLYDTETQMMTYLDKAKPSSTEMKAGVGGDDYIYYLKSSGKEELWRIHPDTLEKELMYEFPLGVKVLIFNTTNDGKYMSVEPESENGYYTRPADTYPVIRINLETKEADWRYYKFDYSNWLNHQQINPTDPDIIAFSHEARLNEVSGYNAIWDRAGAMNMATGEAYFYNQGRMGENSGNAVQTFTHEMWSFDGKYRYLCAWPNNTQEYCGEVNAVVRFDKDGTHPQYYVTNSVPRGSSTHAGMSGDNRMICADSSMVSLISTETHQIFPITDIGTLVGGKGHPYHPHPHVANYHNMANWGHVYKGVLGVAWMDYTDILKYEVAKGGRYSMGDYVDRISYEALECETDITTRAGVECAVAKPGRWLFLDVKRDVLDSNNCAVKLTFDYFDNTDKPIEIMYTKGVEEYNDFWKVYNKQTQIGRTGTNKWKTAEVIIDCINLESIGKFESDFKIKGVQGSAYIANVRIEKIDK